MRVIAGRLRGRRLRAPRGSLTRPTSDRVRESLFDLLGPLRPGGSVLDLFAGTGALGIEALSRGAGRARFVERKREALRVLRANLQALGLAGRGRVVGADALSPRAWEGGPFDLILADPPYGEPLGREIVRRAAEVLSAGGILVLEHVSAESPPAPPETLALWKSRRYGGTQLTLYIRKTEELP